MIFFSFERPLVDVSTGRNVNMSSHADRWPEFLINWLQRSPPRKEKFDSPSTDQEWDRSIRHATNQLSHSYWLFAIQLFFNSVSLLSTCNLHSWSSQGWWCPPGTLGRLCPGHPTRISLARGLTGLCLPLWGKFVEAYQWGLSLHNRSSFWGGLLK